MGEDRQTEIDSKPGARLGQMHGWNVVLDYGNVEAEYRCIAAAAAIVPLGERTQIRLTGGDRQSFLHNLCTNEIRRLNPGQGCEAFLTNVQGKIVGHVLAFCGDDELTIETVAGQGERLLAHLDRYLIREDVQLADVSSEWSEWLVAGPQAEAYLQKAIAQLASNAQTPVPQPLCSHISFELQGARCRIRLAPWLAVPSWLVSGDPALVAEVTESVVTLGARAAGWQALEAARIEAAWPWFTVDITERNLPQEVNRDAATISFVKGCYLGQETVARIDALGHVNRTLELLRFDATEVPAAGTHLLSGEREAGEVTSAVWSPRFEAPLGLAYVRREAKDSPLSTASGKAQIVPELERGASRPS